MNKQALAELAANARAPQDLIAGILEAETAAELEIYRRGLEAFIGQKAQDLADVLEARGQRRPAAALRARGRAAEAAWTDGRDGR